MLAFEEKITDNKPQFIQRVIEIAAALGTNPNWLMAVMNTESGLNHKAQNTTYPLYNGPATGLIQFTPDTALSLGTNINALKAMTNVKQLDYVYEYYEPYKGRLNSYFDAYMAVFFPAAINKPDTWIFETSSIKRSAVARQNPGIDLNKDGQITVAEFKGYLYRTIPARIKNLIFEVKEFVKKNPDLTAILAITLLIIFMQK